MTFTPTCELYTSDGVTLATASYSSWLSFDYATETITVSYSATGLAGVYNLRYECVLDDDDASSEWTTITYYIVESTASAQTDINYLLNQDVITQAITAFTYAPSALPLSGSETWTYSVAFSSGDANICTVASSTGSDILVG